MWMARRYGHMAASLIRTTQNTHADDGESPRGPSLHWTRRCSTFKPYEKTFPSLIQTGEGSSYSLEEPASTHYPWATWATLNKGTRCRRCRQLVFRTKTRLGPRHDRQCNIHYSSPSSSSSSSEARAGIALIVVCMAKHCPDCLDYQGNRRNLGYARGAMITSENPRVIQIARDVFYVPRAPRATDRTSLGIDSCRRRLCALLLGRRSLCPPVLKQRAQTDNSR